MQKETKEEGILNKQTDKQTKNIPKTQKTNKETDKNIT
jgi:hypothetical protein